MKLNLISYIEASGRIVVAEHVDTTKTHLVVKNPTAIDFVENPPGSGQKALILVPTFFAELLEDPTEDVVWDVPRCNVTTGNPKLKDQVERLYLFGLGKISPEAPDDGEIQEGKVVPLFDEE